jgi:hypothetical protein
VGEHAFEKQGLVGEIHSKIVAQHIDNQHLPHKAAESRNQTPAAAGGDRRNRLSHQEIVALITFTKTSLAECEY